MILKMVHRRIYSEMGLPDDGVSRQRNPSEPSLICDLVHVMWCLILGYKL